MKILESLNGYLSRLISIGSPAQIAKAEAASSKLATLNSVTDPAKRVKVLAAAADAIAADTPRTLPNAKAQNDALVATLAAIKSEMPGANSASDAADTIPELIAEIIESASVVPNTLSQARGMMGSVLTAARILKTKTFLPTAAGTSALHESYLKRQSEHMAKSGAFGADVAAAAANGPLTIRKADIIVPPTDADYYDAYVKLQADNSPIGVEKRQKFFAEYGGVIQRVHQQKQRTERDDARAKSQAERTAAANLHAVAADNAKRAAITAQLKAVGQRA